MNKFFVVMIATLTTLPFFSSPTMAANKIPAAKQTLTVYTYTSFTADWGPGPRVKQIFEANCGCNLKFVGLDDGVSVLNRLRLEGKHTKADVILGLDDSLIAEAKNTGLLARHHVDTSKTTLPNGWKDKTFVPFDYGYFAFVYNKDRLKNPPKSLKELVDQRDDIKVIYQDPRTSTPGQGLMLWMKAVYGDHAATAWKKLAKKTVTVTKGWSESYNMFLKGESDMVLSYTTSPAYHIIQEKETKYAAADFSEGHYMQVEVAAKVKTTKHNQLAEQFLTFMLSDKFQSLISTGNWMYPVTNVALPTEYYSLTVPSKTLNFSSEKIAKHRKSWVREWQQALTN